MVFAAIAIGAVSAVHADGAFPDEFSIHFPVSSPHRIFIGANFGLLVSEDDGLTWRYSCEPWVVAGSNAALAFASVSVPGPAIVTPSEVPVPVESPNDPVKVT